MEVAGGGDLLLPVPHAHGPREVHAHANNPAAVDDRALRGAERGREQGHRDSEQDSQK